MGPSFAGGTRIFNRAGAEFKVTGDGDFFPRSATTTFLNEGTFTKSGAGTTDFLAGFFGGSFSAFILDNQGTLNLTGGDLVLRGGGSSTTPIQVQAGATLTLASDFSYAAGTSLSGAGTIQFNSGTHDLTTGQFLPSGTVNFNGATVTIGNAIAPNSLGPFKGIVNFNADQTLDSLTLQGTIGGSGNLALTGTSTLTSGGFGGAGQLIVPTGSTLNVPSGGQLNRVLDNQGKVNLGS